MKLGGRMGIGSAETLENFFADLFVHGDMGRICVCLYRLPDYIAKGRLKTPNAFSDDLLIFPHLYSYVIFPPLKIKVV